MHQEKTTKAILLICRSGTLSKSYQGDILGCYLQIGGDLELSVAMFTEWKGEMLAVTDCRYVDFALSFGDSGIFSIVDGQFSFKYAAYIDMLFHLF